MRVVEGGDKGTQYLRYKCAILSMGDIKTETLSFRLRAGCKGDHLAL
jgi:hypothetical protein